MDFVVPAQDFLEHELRFAVGIDRPLRERLVDRHASGGPKVAQVEEKTNRCTSASTHGVEQVHPSRNVVAEIFGGILHRLADQALAAKCMTAFGFGLPGAHGSISSAARKIAADERRPFVNRATMTFGQVVEDNDVVAFIEQELDANAPDVSRSADDKDFHPRKVRRTSPLSKESPLERPEGLRGSLDRARIMCADRRVALPRDASTLRLFSSSPIPEHRYRPGARPISSLPTGSSCKGRSCPCRSARSP